MSGVCKTACVAALLVFTAVACAGSAKRIHYRGVSYDVYIAHPRKDSIEFFWKDRDGEPFMSFDAVRRWLRARNRRLVFATNGGIFEWGLRPLGLYIERHQLKVKPNYRKGRGNFYLQPNGVFYIGRRAGVMTMRAYRKFRPDARFATQSGPMLVLNGRIHPVFRRRSDSRYIRNGVGIDRHGRIVFAISNRPVNFYTFASLFKHRLKCINALYLDGNISRMYLPQKKRHDLGGSFAVIIAVSRPGKRPADRRRSVSSADH